MLSPLARALAPLDPEDVAELLGIDDVAALDLLRAYVPFLGRLLRWVGLLLALAALRDGDRLGGGRLGGLRLAGAALAEGAEEVEQQLPAGRQIAVVFLEGVDPPGDLLEHLHRAVVDLHPLLEQAPVDGLRDGLARGQVLLLGLRLEQRLGG
ncbi:hypothetical protein [Sorangium sp. So ce1151]|uniref:hypothetical protein n=1 Tax=Sorangium sp. So ce1151 TaxID=3133332 RepID=UPI003F628159